MISSTSGANLEVDENDDEIDTGNEYVCVVIYPVKPDTANNSGVNIFGSSDGSVPKVVRNPDIADTRGDGSGRGGWLYVHFVSGDSFSGVAWKCG